MNILDNFRLKDEQELSETVIANISANVVFKGTNLWILVFAIFIASLGLNINSTAVIIGAMLISPLMGPIMGLGMGMAINDLALLRKAWTNYLFAAVAGLITSTIYFLLSPINEAHSEILARTAPNIYDVLIAFFGGLAGILAMSSRQKGNVIPGVAIATALMPPLCTAGYGLATLQFSFFFGAFYLFIINTVFIALATLLTARFLKFPFKTLPAKSDEKKAQRIVWAIVVVTVLPSIYFGYDIVQQNKFQQKAKRFIENEGAFPNDYLLKKTVDAKKKTITLTYGGEYIEPQKIETLKSKLPMYDLSGSTLEIQQGFSYLKDNGEIDKQSSNLSLAITEKESQIYNYKLRLDSIANEKALAQQVYKELKVQYPAIKSCVLQIAMVNTDSTSKPQWVAIIDSRQKFDSRQKLKIGEWLKVRINSTNLKTYF